MKKNSFMEGTIIATVAIFVIKIIGMLYVIPFYAIVGPEGAALYAYAYTIYGLFLEIATAGIPHAVSKIVNEYNTLDKQEAKIRAYALGKKILIVIAILAFVILFVFAPQISHLIIGEIQGGNTSSDISFVIRCVSFAILVFPFLSMARGFLQGHNIITPPSMSQVIEQLVRVIIIIFGSYIAIHFLNLGKTYTIGIAVFGAFIGGLCSYWYINHKIHKNKKELHLTDNFKQADPVTNKEIIKKIISYALPTIIISLAFAIYNNVDMILILRTMDFLGLDAAEAEFVSTSISTWAAKISVIITSVGLGLSTTLIPNMVEAYTLKKYQDVNNKFNKALEIMFFITLPMCVGIALLSKPIWSIFYGTGFLNIGASILAISIFTPLFSNFYTISNYTLQSMNQFKIVYLGAILGIVTNALLDVPIMLLFDVLKLPPYWGASVASIIGFSVTLIIAMHYLKKNYDFKYQEVRKIFKNSLVPLLTMIVVVALINKFITIDYVSRFSCIIYVGITALIGASVYMIVAYKMGLVNEVLGSEFFTKLKNKFKPKQKRSN